MGQHAHIVPVYLLQNIIHPKLKRNIPFVFSEFMPKGSLKGYFREQGKLSLKESVALGIQLCDGLLHGYRYGLRAHLDLKPENIMVLRNHVFKVTDFSANVIGTPGYMAPEQIIVYWNRRGVKIDPFNLLIDERADQFVVGLIVLEAYLGRPAFPICQRAYVGEEWAREYVRGGVGRIDDISLPGGLRGVLARCFAPKHEDRFSGLSGLREGLLGVYESEFGDYIVPEVEADDSATWWFNRGMAFYSLGYYISSVTPFREALERFSSIHGTDIDQANCLMNLGTAYRENGEFTKAEAHFQMAIKRFYAIPGTEISRAKCLMNLGTVYRETSQFTKAEEYHKEALKRFSSIPGTEIDQANCLMNLGTVYSSTGEFTKAETHFQEAIERFSAILGTEISQAKCLASLGALYYQIEEIGKAKEVFRKSLKICVQCPLGTEKIEEVCLERLGQILIDETR